MCNVDAASVNFCVDYHSGFIVGVMPRVNQNINLPFSAAYLSDYFGIRGYTVFGGNLVGYQLCHQTLIFFPVRLVCFHSVVSAGKVLGC